MRGGSTNTLGIERIIIKRVIAKAEILKLGFGDP